MYVLSGSITPRTMLGDPVNFRPLSGNGMRHTSWIAHYDKGASNSNSTPRPQVMLEAYSSLVSGSAGSIFATSWSSKLSTTRRSVRSSRRSNSLSTVVRCVQHPILPMISSHCRPTTFSYSSRWKACHPACSSNKTNICVDGGRSNTSWTFFGGATSRSICHYSTVVKSGSGPNATPRSEISSSSTIRTSREVAGRSDASSRRSRLQTTTSSGP